MDSSVMATKTLRSAAWWGLLALIAASCTAPTGDTSTAPASGSAGHPVAPWSGVHAVARLDPSAIDESQLVVLAGNTHPKALGADALVLLPDDQVIEHMQLVLKRSDEQETALVAHIDALHDKTSTVYQQWLKAEDFGDKYGVSKADVAEVSRWLERHGFQVDGVPPSRMFIEFTGTVAQVSAAFHTKLASFQVDGQLHFANLSDPQLPAELTKVVEGVHSLHDFKPHAMRKDRGQVKRDGATGAWRITKPSPDFDLPFGGQCFSNADCPSGTCNVSTGVCACTTAGQCGNSPTGAAVACNTKTQTCAQCATNADCLGPATCNTATGGCQQTIHAVAPADFATIYNLNPLFAQGINGAGQTIVVLEDTYLANPGDVAAFRAAFGLSGGSFKQISPTGAATCTNPGVPSPNGPEGEAALDAEWAGVSAPGANIVLAACADTGVTSNTMFGAYLALENLVNGASPPGIVSLSYGDCESGNGTTANKAYSNLYQQAASEGISVFVSAGDEGAASCDANKTVATHGISVSGFASTAYNVAVGGTDFLDYYNSQNGGPALSTYWAATNSATYGSALSYVPETPWNNSCSSRLIYSTPAMTLGTFTQAYGAAGFCNSTVGKTNYRTTAAGSGGPSNAATATGGWPQPSWQTGVVGLPTKSGGVRNLPDVSLFAANGVFGHFMVYCMTDTANKGGPCDYTNGDDVFTLAAGGTSFAAPALAGIQALVNQKMGGPQGNPNYTYYKLAAAEQGAKGTTRCVSGGANAASPNMPAPECIFNDVTVGDIDLNCANPSKTTTNTSCFGQSGSGSTAVDGSLSVSSTTYTPAYPAGTGWDYATGLGTVNAYNLVNAWSN